MSDGRSDGPAKPEAEAGYGDLSRLRVDLARAVSSVCPAWLADRAEDFVQVALLRIADLQKRSEGKAEFSSFYLRKTAYSAVVDEIRRLRRRREVPLLAESEEMERPAKEPDPERSAAGRQTGQAIRRCLEGMIRPRRLAVTLHLQGHAVAEAATLLGWSVKKAENLVYRGMADLRACLDSMGDAAVKETPDEELARLRRAFASPANSPSPESCPPPDQIWAAVRGELPPDEIREMVDHTARCADCAEDWRLAAAFEHGPQEADSALRKPASTAHRFFLSHWERWAAAAAAAVLLATGILQWAPWQGGSPVVIASRGAHTATLRSLVPEKEPLQRHNCLLRWSPVKAAISYELLVSDPNLRVLADVKRLTSPWYRVPPAALAGLPPRARIYWQVEAVLSDGKRVTSDSFRSTLE